ncbi:MAG: hypothetical protein RIQ60_1619 [Pseudomonadota bacterium]|jgi:RNA polymerase sigma-70 factor (ECF subfamily)
MADAVDDWTSNSSALADLLARVALADRAALAALYRQTSAQLLGVILRINTDRAQAEEVLQDVYVNLWRSARSFNDLRSQPMTWLTSVARNRAIDSLRQPQGVSPSSTSHISYTSRTAGRGLALQQLQQAADVRALGDALAGLSPAQQHALALSYYQGLSHAEVATQLAQPLCSAKQQVRQALLQLRQSLSRACGLEAGASTPGAR